MATKEEHQEAGNRSLQFLHKFKNDELTSANKCYFFQFNKRKKHLNQANYYQSLIEKVGINPNSITIACRVPDWVLGKMGW